MKNLEAYPYAPVHTETLPDLFAETAGDSKTIGHQTFSPRQWYWFGLAVVALVFVAEMALTWRKWSNITGDLGLDLYVPWRLSQGAILYRDVFIFAGGPFSQYFDALLFKIFGASFLTLAISNLTAIAVMLLVLFRRFASAADTWTAVTICLGTTVVFAFAYYFYEGFNYVIPYSNEAVHGLVLSIVALGFLSDWVSTRRMHWAILAGFCSGLVFLTKPDIFLALAAAGITAFGLLLFLFRETRFAVKSFAAFLAAGIIPPLFFFFYFLRVENWHDSLHSVVFGWVPMFTAAVVKNPIYQWCTGLDRPYFHLRNIMFQSARVAIVTAFYAAAFRLIKSQKQDWTPVQQRSVPLFTPVLITLVYAAQWFQLGEPFSTSFLSMLACLWLFLALGIFLLSTAASRCKPDIYRSSWAIVLLLMIPLWTLVHTDWLDYGYSLPLLVLVSGVLIFRNRHTLARQQKFVFPFLWTVFGLMMLSKMGVFPRIWNYGFVLAMPAFAAGAYSLLWLLPMLLEKKWQVPALPFRSTMSVVLILGFVSLFRVSESGYAMQKISVGTGSNRMLASANLEHANEFKAALGWIEKNVPKNATIAALPQGAEINFLSRRINPTPCVAWDPNYLAIFGESRMTATYKESPPDYIAIVDRRVKFIDSPCFGSPGYGKDLMQWIQQNYRIQTLIGQEPLKKNGGFGIEILKRLNSWNGP
jgi:hypothetical protein